MSTLASLANRLLGRAPTMQGAVAEDRIAVASQRQLIWWRFKKHKLAVVSMFVVALFYLVVVLADFLAYTDPEASDSRRGYIPPQTISWLDSDGAFRPYVHGLKGVRDMKTFKLVYRIDEGRKVYVRFLAEDVMKDVIGVPVTPRAGESNDSETHVRVCPQIRPSVHRWRNPAAVGALCQTFPASAASSSAVGCGYSMRG